MSGSASSPLLGQCRRGCWRAARRRTCSPEHVVEVVGVQPGDIFISMTASSGLCVARHDLYRPDDVLELPACSSAGWRRDRWHIARHPFRVSMSQGRSHRFTGLPACSPAPSSPSRRRHGPSRRRRRGRPWAARRLLHLNDGVVDRGCWPAASRLLHLPDKRRQAARLLACSSARSLRAPAHLWAVARQCLGASF